MAVKSGPNVVQVYGFCFDAPDGKPRIVMELCPHGSLRAHLKALPKDKVRSGGAALPWISCDVYHHAD